MYHLKLDQDKARAERAGAPFASAPVSEAEKSLITAHRDAPPLLSAESPAREAFDAKRAIDIGVSLTLIVILAPLMLLIALLVAVSDPGPPIYRHRRLGRDGRTFPCMKFRSMCIDADKRLEQLLFADPVLREQWQRDFKLDRDPRVTRLGQLLRVTSMDELPQLFNVLRGDMSLVGPRPIIESELHNYGRYASHYFSVKPGLTGIWQVSGRSSTTYRRRVAADVHYVRTRSLMLDFRILLCTIPAVITGKGSC